MSLRVNTVWFVLLISGTLLLGGCHSGSESRSTRVTVTDHAGNLLPDVNVVLGDSTGAMKNSGTTAADGQITFVDSPVDATVTAAMSCMYSGAATTTYSLDVRYDVNAPVTLRVDGCRTPPAGSTLGTLVLKVTNSISGITQNEVSTNQLVSLGYQNLITQQTLTITPQDLQSDGTLSLFVIGKDANDTSLGYGYILDQVFIDGMTVNITVDQPLSFLQYQIANMPSTTDFLCVDLYQGRREKGGVVFGDCRSLSSAPTTTTIQVPSIPDLGDQFLFSVYASSRQNNGTTTVVSHQYLSSGPSATALSDQSFDFTRTLSVPSVAVSGTGTPTPTISWSNVDPDATQIFVFEALRLASASNLYLGISDMDAARTSITFPELPDSLSAFRPTAVTSFSMDTFATDPVFMSSGIMYYGSPSLAASFQEQASRKHRSQMMRPAVR